MESQMNKLQLSRAAQKDLLEIKSYIAVDLENPKAAMEAIKRITKKIRLLNDNPLMGAALASISGANSDERFLVCGSYMVFYRITRENIFIDRVLYGRRDYLRVLFDKTELPEQEGSETTGGGTSHPGGAAAFCLFREIQGTLRSQR